MQTFFTIIGAAISIALLVFGIALLWTVVTWWAWNLVIPFLFKLPQISLLQAFAVNLLTATFFKSTTTLNCK